MFSSLMFLLLISSSINTLGIQLSPPTSIPKSFSLPMYRKDQLAKKDMARFHHTATSDEETSYRTSLYDLGSEYAVYLSVGDPPQSNAFLVDTGSELLWMQCEPCRQCFNQTDSLLIFDPFDSLSYKEINCNSAQCHHHKSFIKGCNDSKCRYEYNYADKSYSHGKIITEMLTFSLDGDPVENIVMGCGNDNAGVYSGVYNGILGLGPGSYSLINQMRVTNFSFCLPGPNFFKSTTLDMFYTGPDKKTTIIAPLFRNPFTTYHYVGFKGISLNNEMVPIPSFNWDPNYNHGVIIDSGTVMTRIPRNAYNIFLKAFLDFTTDDMIPTEPPKDHVDLTCFSTWPEKYSVPEIKFHFTSTSSLTLTTMQVFTFDTIENRIGEETKLLVCLGFVPMDIGFTILGSKQLQGTRQTFDMVNSKLKLTPNECY
jgi:hypothetical protein